MRQGIRLHFKRKSPRHLLQHSKPNLVSPGRQKIKNNGRHKQHSQPQHSFDSTNPIISRLPQLHLLHVPLPQQLQIQSKQGSGAGHHTGLNQDQRPTSRRSQSLVQLHSAFRILAPNPPRKTRATYRLPEFLDRRGRLPG